MMLGERIASQIRGDQGHRIGIQSMLWGPAPHLQVEVFVVAEVIRAI